MRHVSIGGQVIVVVDDNGLQLNDEQGALDLLGEIYGSEAEWVAIPVSRLAPDFFELRNRKAGGFFQKLTNYRMKALIVGDISEHLANSKALQDFVRECNRGGSFRFLNCLSELAGSATSP
ncbi:DUF4180 domain-containing protein [Pelagibacterium lentulum]|uniref:DUF4180 domain-containing protein n=1 Tax=Pelagibacterium lentulum TaxID=2029865 RepID=A0A916VYM7_9HYPH|nr:DUF4180 domain-containing protein [Pelagibacterium lentulum]GGA52595.1 hypothetical protein GCM10011499_23350 [Pelagibacterium lentulum]